MCIEDLKIIVLIAIYVSKEENFPLASELNKHPSPVFCIAIISSILIIDLITGEVICMLVSTMMHQDSSLQRYAIPF